MGKPWPLGTRDVDVSPEGGLQVLSRSRRSPQEQGPTYDLTHKHLSSSVGARWFDPWSRALQVFLRLFIPRLLRNLGKHGIRISVFQGHAIHFMDDSRECIGQDPSVHCHSSV